MARKNTQALQNLSRRERQIMELFFTESPCTVAQVTERFPDTLSNNAIRTFLGILENKGLLKREKKGREFIYAPTLDSDTAAQSALSKVLDVFFQGSLSDAVAARFSANHADMDDEELARLEELIAEARRQNQ